MIDDVQEERQAVLMAQRVIEKFETPLYIENHKIDANFSIGVSIYPSNGITQKELFKSADIAMYQAKSEGKNMFKAYTSELDEKVQKNILLNQQLENALKNSEFVILYQPKLNLNDSSIKEAEALIRWRQGERLVSAAEFIPVAERSSMIIKIGDWVIDTVCKQIKYFEQQSTPTRISINISNAQLKEYNFVSNVSRMISFYDITPSLIEFEISESILINNSDSLIPVLTELKKLGIKLAIDEFGKGFSSMGYMSRLPIDKIKIDKTLMNEIFSTKHRSLISAMISLGHALDLSVTAEGIEIDRHLQESIKLNVDSAQGYFLAEPLAAEELLNFYLSKKGDKSS
jgi:EAL domain-containing protein (putative c-di-GMP-specific phosphodiesterase class I)